MPTRQISWLLVFIGSVIGGYIPTLLGESFLSMASLFWSAIVSIIGIFVGYKLGILLMEKYNLQWNINYLLKKIWTKGMRK
jgi:riboflavin transporter FmnP